jgi:hypothetical protein
MMSGRGRPFGVGLVMVLLTLTSACSNQPRRVDCDGRLEAINRSAPKANGVQGTRPDAPAEKRDR